MRMLIGLVGAGLGVFLPWSVGSASWPGPCRGLGCSGLPEVQSLTAIRSLPREMPWMPWIVEGDTDTLLVEAPLPHDYDPRAQHADLVADILVLRTGQIEDAILEGTSGQHRLNQEIVAFIRHNWRVMLPPKQATWFRVQISQPDFPRPDPEPSS